MKSKWFVPFLLAACLSTGCHGAFTTKSQNDIEWSISLAQSFILKRHVAESKSEESVTEVSIDTAWASVEPEKDDAGVP